MDVVCKKTQMPVNFIEVEALTPHFFQNMIVFRLIEYMRFQRVIFFAIKLSSRLIAAVVTLRDRSRLIYYCHRRTSCPTNLKSLWLSLPLPFLHVLNKSQKFLQLLQSQRHLNTNICLAGRGLVFAHAVLPQSDQRKVSC